MTSRRLPTSAWRAHLLLSVLYVLTRAALHVAGLRFSFALDWMWLADPSDLRDRLAETLYYFHAFPPGMNLLTGILLKLAGDHAAALGLAVFRALGLALVNALFSVCRASGVPDGLALGVAIGFSFAPQSIFFEHLYLYEWPVTTLLCVAAVLFYRGTRSGSPTTWTAFFLVCAAISLTRSTFHLAWFAVMVALGAGLSDRRARGRIVAAACIPAMLLLAVYAKNLALFGEFAASTFGPASLTLVTVARLPSDVRDAWMADGTLSPFAGVSVYAAPREYLPFFGTGEKPGWPPQVTRLEHTSVNAANFNHWFLLDVHRRRRADVLEYLRRRPLDYLANVAAGMKDMFGPSTGWHPREGTTQSPHFQHRQVLGGYEARYNRAVHTFPAAPVGLYVFLPVVWLWTLWRAWSLRQSGDTEADPRGALLYFCLFQIVFVVVASSMLTFRESARYRFQVEPMIWSIAAFCAWSAWQAIEGKRWEAGGER